MENSNYIDWNNAASYPLQWIYESEPSRWQYQMQMFRVDLAMTGLPHKNLYQEQLESNIQSLPAEDRKVFYDKNKCVDIAPGKSFVIRKAVNTIANQMASGVESYEYRINDPWGSIAPDTEDRLGALCSQDYVANRLEQLAPTFSRDLTKYGMCAVAVRYCIESDKNIVERINPKNVWFDTMYSSTGRERFRGYSRMISWAELKKLIEMEKDEINPKLEVPDAKLFDGDKLANFDKLKVSKKKIRTLNGLDIYVENLNKLAMSPQLQAPIHGYWEYEHDLRSCYSIRHYQTYATDPKAKTKSGYNGDDVELTVMYDMDRKIEFKIINRRFVISANHETFCRKVPFKIYNVDTDDFDIRLRDFNLDCPLKFIFEEFESRDKFVYPISPIMTFLDTHDELCAWRAKREHVAKILSILRIVTNGGDASSLKRTFNIMGVILDDIQGDVQSLLFNYDYSSIDSQIEYLEKTIIDGLNAYNQFDALQVMGDRATATEAGTANNAIAQGLSIHNNNIMAIYADIARQCIGNRVAYSPEQEFAVMNMGQASTVTVQEMAMDAIVNVLPKTAKNIHEKMLATNAINLLGVLPNVGGGISETGVAELIQQALFGQVSRKMAQSFVKPKGPSPEEIQLAQQQAKNQADMLQQNDQAYMNNPIPYELDNAQQQLSPDEMDQLITGLNAGQSDDMVNDPRMGQNLNGEDVEENFTADITAGNTPELGGMMGNEEFNAEV